MINEIKKMKKVLVLLVYLVFCFSTSMLIAQETKTSEEASPVGVNPQPEQVAPQKKDTLSKKGYRKHDGFLFRYMIGYSGGDVNANVSIDKSDDSFVYNFKMKGSLPIFFDIGGAVNDYVLLHAGLRFVDTELRSVRIEEANANAQKAYIGKRGEITTSVAYQNSRFFEASLDFGATFYIMPAMVFFRPTINILTNTTTSVIETTQSFVIPGSTSTNSTSTVFATGNLFSGYGLTIGKEWWAADDTALGLAVFYQVNNTRHRISYTHNIDTERVINTNFNSRYYGMLLTVTYN